MPKSSRRNRRLRVAAWLTIAACAVIIAVVALSPSAPPPTPAQACVASIRAQPASEVTGYTPACMRLTVAQRNAAIRQASGG